MEASVRSQREAAEARAGAGAPQAPKQRHRLLGSSSLGKEDGGSDAIAAASSLADAQMDVQWRAVSVLYLSSCLATLGCGGCVWCASTKVLLISIQRADGRYSKGVRWLR